MRDMDATGGDTLIGDAISFVGNNLYFRFGAGYLDYYGTSSELKVEDAKGLAAQAFGPGETNRQQIEAVAAGTKKNPNRR